ncbi:MAG: gluconolactonase [Bacteroidetes bacterium MedPE-SWsnd-G1]|nr:MAG: gluconolactonase [Bacteroidetes bacterium MedPE-SWsnd-G1]
MLISISNSSIFGQSFNTTNSSNLVGQGATLRLISDIFEFTEGPASDNYGNVFFTDQPNNRIHKWDADSNTISIYLEPSGRSNGLYFDTSGNLLACADEKFELWQIDSNKKITILLDNYKDKKLNGPNDLWLDKKGGIYFTDPYYQRPYWTRTAQEQTSQNLYYLSPDKKTLKMVHDDFIKPNGIIGTPNDKTLFVADIGAEKIYSFTINDDASLTNKTLFTSSGSDGMTIDELGNIYITNQKGVTAFNSEGVEILNIPIPQSWTANVTFGGPNKNILFITAMNSIYTLKMNVKGVN